MKVSLTYPKIPDSKNCPLKKIIAFEKIDGTNIHFNYNPIDGFVSYGTRRDNFSLNISGVKEFNNLHPGLENVHNVFYKDFSKCLECYLFEEYEYSIKEAIIFMEYWGLNSFAGQHRKENQKYLTLIDVMIDGKFIFPKEFVKQYESYDIPQVVYPKMPRKLLPLGRR